MYTEKDLVYIAKRENNNKRKYLVVNRLQGKHIPVSPKSTFAMFGELADMVKEAYKNERLLLVGFAETATAIGTFLAIRLDSWYMQTTREDIRDVEYLFFSEEHSHATEQRLIKTDLDKIIDDIDRIIFVEDEVTTGNTILNIIAVIKKAYQKNISFSVASLLNGMNKEAEKQYDDRGIKLHYLVKTNHEGYTETAEGYKGDGNYFPADTANYQAANNQEFWFHTYMPKGYIDARRLNKGVDYFAACMDMYQEISQNIETESGKHILVLGTEEFMYPALFVAEKLELKGHIVKCHSTTRSPIAVSSETDYPLHKRYELVSLYDKSRLTYIYDLAQYDEVIILTDSKRMVPEGINSLIHAVCTCKNNKIILVRWNSE